MTTEKWPPLDPGTRVRTTSKKTPDREWTPEALIVRKWGVTGRIVMHHDSHGLCYDVQHDDGTEGCYDPNEFDVLPDSGEDPIATTMEPLKIGTQRWWEEEFIHGRHGIVHAIMNLVVDRHITPRKGVEVVEQLMKPGRGGEIPPAPWEDVRW